MDPATVIGLVVSLQQLIVGAYKIGQDAANAKVEIRRLSVELSALKAALEHVQLILDFSQYEEGAEDDGSVLKTTNFSTPEFKEMLGSTETILAQLRDRLEPKTHGIKKAWQRLTWHFEKGEIEEYLKRLDRAKSWFTLASTSDNVMICRQSFVSIRNIEQTLQSQLERAAEEDSAELLNSIKKWLAPYDSYRIFREAFDAFHHGTGKWLLDGICQDWVRGGCLPLLWLRAKPGFGKTTLISAAIDQAQRSRKSSMLQGEIAYFFCSFAEQQSQDLRNILGSLIFQLCDNHTSLLIQIHERFQQEKNPKKSQSCTLDQLTLGELEDLLTHVLQKIGRAYIFVDAINESKDSDELMKILIQVAERNENLHMLVSSTEDTALDTQSALLETIRVEEMTNSHDIKLYVDAWLVNDGKMRRLSDQLKAEISENLQRKAQGVYDVTYMYIASVLANCHRFRWVQCQMDTLGRQKTIKDLRSALSGLPATLEQTYQRILARIPAEDTSLAKNTLLWLCFSRRPMRFEEICEAVVLGDSPQMDEQARLLRPADLLETCSSLITYSTHTRCLSLAHSSVRKFLTSSSLASGPSSVYRLSWRSADEIISRCCLSYLLLPHFAEGYVATLEEFLHRLQAWPLLTYIADALWDHLYTVDPQGTLEPLLSAFLNSHRLPRAGNFGSWVQAFNPKIPAHRIETTTPLYWAAREGHLPLVRLILVVEGTKDLEKAGGMHSSTPLHVAAWAGYTEVVRELLAAGANVHERNRNGESGLRWAIWLGHTEIQHLLLEAGATVESDMTALAWQMLRWGNLSNSAGTNKSTRWGMLSNSAGTERSAEVVEKESNADAAAHRPSGGSLKFLYNSDDSPKAESSVARVAVERSRSRSPRLSF